MKVEKNIPFRNYIILAVILILSVVGVIYFYMWYNEFETNIINTPIIDKYLNVINYNELDNYLVENENVIIYISELNDIETRKFEKKFKKIINEYSLNKNILYLNLTEEKKNSNIYNKIKSNYQFNYLPVIVIFKNGKLIDVYEIRDNDYDIELLISYLKIEGVIND